MPYVYNIPSRCCRQNARQFPVLTLMYQIHIIVEVPFILIVSEIYLKRVLEFGFDSVESLKRNHIYFIVILTVTLIG